jgi:D-lactate dehydrogenase (cytochrome)
VTAPDRVRTYLSDESAAFHGRAEAVWLPADEAELAEVVREANRSGTLLTLSGGGTSITGSRVATCGGAVVSTERIVAPVGEPPPGFERIEAEGFTVFLNRDRRRAVVPPAMTLEALDRLLDRAGLLYPPDPTELSATMGGTVATNASGARSFHYGPTRAWVRRLRVVLPTGEVAELRRGDAPARGGRLRFRADGGEVEVPLPDEDAYRMPRTKNAAGLYLARGMEPIDLFVGCEGLLGAVTEVEVALVERIPKTLTVIGYFRSVSAALDFVDWGATRRASDEGVRLSRQADTRLLSLEYFDGRALAFMREEHPEVPASAAAVLFELPYPDTASDEPYPPNELLSALETELARHDAAENWAVPAARREDVRLFRHALPEAVNDYVRRRAGKIGSDMAVPHAHLREMMDAYERESSAAGVRFLIFGHIGDGHLHLNYLPEDEAEADRALRAYSRLARRAVELDGTISAEHGVGKKTILDPGGRRVPYLQVLYGEGGLRAIAAVKKALDPRGILNIGNMVPAEMVT